MKCFSFIVGLVLLCQATCLVTNRPKIESTTDSFKNDTARGIKEINDVERYNKTVYLEDVVFALLSQNWSKEEEPCLNQTLLLIQNLRNFTLWAVWEWDSIPSEPQGLLFGNRYQLGNFDECLKPPWVSNRPELMTQYCLADIVLERTDTTVKKRQYMGVSPDQSVLDYMMVQPLHSRPPNELTWAVCVPASCGSVSVERLLKIMLARSHLGVAGLQPRITTNDCQKSGEERTPDGFFWAFIVVVAALLTTALICTYFNIRRDKSKPKAFNIIKAYISNINSGRNTLLLESIRVKSLMNGITVQREEPLLGHDVIQAFCLQENAKNLLKMQKGDIEVLYGIRFLGLCGIVVAHTFGLHAGSALTNGIQVDQEDANGLIGLLVLHSDLLVDTFFMLSGFLTATAFNQIRRFPNPLFAILRRYIRLVPAFAIVVFYVTAVYPYTGSGPLWPRAVASDTDQCRKNWWLALLMLNNYIDSEHICLVVSWYIPCDFHFSCAAVILYWVYTHQPRLGLACAGAVTFASVLLPGCMTYTYDWIPIQLFTYEFTKNPRASPDFHRMYIKSHYRAGAYIVGFFSGFIFIKNRRENVLRIPQKWSILWAISGLVIMFAIMMSGTTFLWRSYHPIEGAVYAALNRPVWTVGVAMLVLSCSLGYVPIIKGFLSWYVWVPLSRLSYGLYLTHTLIIARTVFTQRSSDYHDYLTLIISAVGVMFWGCLAAFLIWLLAEAPAIRLFDATIKRMFKTHVREHKMEEKPSTQQTSTQSIASGSGHLQDNLPATVNFTSKF